MARKKKSKGLQVSLMLTVGLMIVSFAAGMLTQKIVFREPQTDAGLTYIEDIPVMTDFLPEGTRARPGQKREIRYLVIHETDNTGTGRKCGRAQLVHPPERQRRGGHCFVALHGGRSRDLPSSAG